MAGRTVSRELYGCVLGGHACGSREHCGWDNTSTHSREFYDEICVKHHN